MEPLNKRIEAFKRDLDVLLDKHGFAGLYRQILEKECMTDVYRGQLVSRYKRARATEAYAKVEKTTNKGEPR
jgi:hypothetical protein